MVKGLGNNPLVSAPVQDELIRQTVPAAPVAADAGKPAAGSATKLVSKSLQLDSLLNERLRRCAFESRTKEAQIMRDALHAWLAQHGF